MATPTPNEYPGITPFDRNVWLELEPAAPRILTYTFTNATGSALYIGTTAYPYPRWTALRAKAEWWDEATELKVWTCDDQQAANKHRAELTVAAAKFDAAKVVSLR
jgi:hypothetical protein